MMNLSVTSLRQASYAMSTRGVSRWNGRRSVLPFMIWLVLAATAGCAGTPNAPTRYTLPVPEVSESYPDNGLEAVVVKPMRMTRYLDGEGIVMQMSDIEVQQARTHLWAEPLSRQLRRNLRQYLSAALPDTRVLGEAAAPRQLSAPSVRVEVEHFQGRYDGSVIVSGIWEIRDAEGGIHARRGFSVERVLDADGYPALVRNLAQAWGEVAAQIAARLAELQ